MIDILEHYVHSLCWKPEGWFSFIWVSWNWFSELGTGRIYLPISPFWNNLTFEFIFDQLLVEFIYCMNLFLYFLPYWFEFILNCLLCDLISMCLLLIDIWFILKFICDLRLLRNYLGIIYHLFLIRHTIWIYLPFRNYLKFIYFDSTYHMIYLL